MRASGRIHRIIAEQMQFLFVSCLHRFDSALSLTKRLLEPPVFTLAAEEV
ncbi:hypothetical protein CGRA01v4_04053 [Colletotrichum graminicola]|nr:hypothetical protein CGRA01v4_04053 [Colletotrichum graminicola]